MFLGQVCRGALREVGSTPMARVGITAEAEGCGWQAIPPGGLVLTV